MRFWSIAVLVVLLIGCAQQRPLSGGEKDVTAPQVLAVYPEPLSTHFSSEKIEFVFDEYVQLNNVYQELIVSPPLTTQPIIKIHKKSVIVQLREPLKENTTYTFNFGDGIVDVNESNKAKDLIYVVSTGEVLDSMVVVGTTKMPFTNERLGGLKIMLFNDTVDILNAKKAVPSYFARTFADGSFVIPYLPEGHFKILALEDENGNYQIDADERVSLISECDAVQNDSLVSTHEVHFDLFEQLPRSIDITSYDADSTGRFKMVWNPHYDGRFDFNVEALNGDFESVRYFTPEHDSIFFQLMGEIPNRNVKVRMSYGDDADTLEIPFYKEEFKTSLKLSHNVSGKMKWMDSIYFETKVPLANVDFSKSELLKDSLPVAFTNWSKKSLFELVGSPKLNAGTAYELRIFPGFATDIAGNTNDTLKLKFTTLKPEDLGTLILEVGEEFQGENGWIVVLDKSSLVVWKEEVKGRSSIAIENLKPNEYSVLYFEDKNNNQHWDGIDLMLQTPAEKVIQQSQKFNVRANWEMKVKLELPK
ncbi:MAG: Ig-like domain-containing protein [Flavobacteriales bacterium]